METLDTTDSSAVIASAAPQEPAPQQRPRGVPYARIWTQRGEPLALADLADALTDRGFVAGFSDPHAQSAPLTDAGLAEARFVPGDRGYRVVSLASGRGGGCRVFVEVNHDGRAPDADDYRIKRAVPRPRLIYRVEGEGPSNSDRNLAENIAEALMVLTNGAVEIGGLGTKGNKPVGHTNHWLGSLRK
jgi:hypothetical protein